MNLGASRVVVEEVEGGIEVLAQVLRELDVPRNVIDSEVSGAREATRSSERSTTLPRNGWSKTSALSALKVESVLVVAGSEAGSRTLRDLDLRAATGASLVALQREGMLQSHPGADDVLTVGDIAYLIGEPDALHAAVRLLGTSLHGDGSLAEIGGVDHDIEHDGAT